MLRNGRTVVTDHLEGWTEARLTEAMIGRRTERFTRSASVAHGSERMSVRDLRWRDRINGVDLTLHGGEILVLTGLLGAGQNEIARVLGGDLAPDGGTLLLDGNPRSVASPAEAVAAGICLLSDDRKREGVLPHLSLRDNIALPSLGRRSFAGLVKLREEQAATRAAAQRFGVVSRSLRDPIAKLSGGNQQKALLSRWELAEADIFIMIEPTRGVDVRARAEIYGRLEGLARKGKALLVVSSDLPEVLAIADRILVILDGRITAETTPDALTEEDLNLLIQGTR